MNHFLRQPYPSRHQPNLLEQIICNVLLRTFEDLEAYRKARLGFGANELHGSLIGNAINDKLKIRSLTTIVTTLVDRYIVNEREPLDSQGAPQGLVLRSVLTLCVV